MAATAIPDFSRVEEVLATMSGIIAETGVDLPDLAARIEFLKGENAKAKCHSENTDAALWAGDHVRAEALYRTGSLLKQDALHDETNQLADAMRDLGEAPMRPSASAYPIERRMLKADLSNPHEDTLSTAALLGADPFADLAAGLPEAVNDLLLSGADLNTPAGPYEYTALLAALDAPGRNAKTLDRLIAAGADPSGTHPLGDNALTWAMGYRHLDTVTGQSERTLIAYLADKGADPNHKVPGYLTAIQRALFEAGSDQVAALFAAGADLPEAFPVDFQPEKLASATGLMVAAPKPDVLAILLAEGADPNQQDVLGRTATDFLTMEVEAAWGRVDEADPWTLDHAEALEISLGMLERHPG
ncbi:MAG: hypothetical protein AAF871_07055 [Pseudomonadota bacterium]